MGYPALAISLVLIAWLLVRDGKRRVSLSAVLWLPTLVVCMLASRTPAEWLGLGSNHPTTGLSNTASGSPVNQAFYILVIILAFAIASSRGVKWGRLLAANGALTCFYAFFFASPLWSIYPWDSFKRVVTDFGLTVIVIAVILSEKDPAEAIRAIGVRSACVLFPLSLLFYKYTFGRFGRIYDRGGHPEFTGVASQKNSFGEMVMVLMLFLVWDMLATRSRDGRGLSGRFLWDRIALLLLGGWFLHRSHSETSLVCFFVGLSLIAARKQLSSRLFARGVLLTALSIPLLVVFTRALRFDLTPLLHALGRDSTFTGRTDIWAHITFTTVNPLIGTGFWTFWGGPGGRAIQEAMRTAVPNAHDGYLDIFLDGGLIGLCLLFTWLFVSGRKLAGALQDNRYRQMKFVFLIVAILVNVTETNFARPTLVWFIAVFALMESPFAEFHGATDDASEQADRDTVRSWVDALPATVGAEVSCASNDCPSGADFRDSDGFVRGWEMQEPGGEIIRKKWTTDRASSVLGTG